MKIKCEYCGSFISDIDEKCICCGAPNNNLKRTGMGVPKTIDELKEWYTAHNLPPEEVTRFFIGKDYRKPRAFGIYKDLKTGYFVVYKNKANGQRAIRYQGKDETYAVHELYLRLKEEIANQKMNNRKKQSNNSVRHQSPKVPLNYKMYKKQLFLKENKYAIIMLTIFFLFMGIMLSGFFQDESNGYYRYNDYYYYYQNGRWYSYDEDEGWSKSSKDSIPRELRDDKSDYEVHSASVTAHGVSDFEDDSWGSSSSSSSSWDDDDWDSSSYWDSDSSWDSSSTDWDSDW